MSNLSLKLVIDGSATGALRALNEVKSGTTAVENQLKRLQDAGRNALQFAGVGLGISELIQLADSYTQMTSRLKLVTQYTGDYNTVLAGLSDSARATRSDLGATVDLFTKISPSLRGIGLNGAQAIGVITTINQAIGISGASSQSAAAALQQLGQGLGAGALRGDEFNSVMEQTPGLAQAIADGLGVPIGELRGLAEQGKLTAETVAGALQKVAPQVEADFARMPKTVGQALTGLKNEFLLFVGATDQASGSTSTLANVIGAVAQEFRDAGPVVTALSESVKVMINGFDGLYRMIKIVALGLAGYAAAATLALSGDFKGARQVWQDLGKDIEDVLAKPLLTAPKLEAAAVDSAKKRELLEAQLATQVEKLEAQKLYVATGSLDKITAKEKESIDQRIADQQRLVDAVRTAWQASLKEAETAAEKAQALRDKATEKKTTAGDKATQIREKDLSPEDKQFLDAQRANEALSQGSYAAARAGVAQLEGRGKDFEKYSKTAEQFLERAMKFAEAAGDANLVEDVGARQAALFSAQAGAEEKKGADLKTQAEAQAKTLNDLQAQLEKMKTDARAIEVKVELADAETKIKGLKGQIEALPDKTVTVTVNTVNAGTGAPAVAVPEVARAFGGPLPGSAPHDRADNMMYWGTPGEWVIQRPAARYYGAAFMAAINNMRLPKFAMGGQIGGSAIDRLSVPSLSPSARADSALAGITLDFGSLGKHDAMAPLSTQREIERVFKRAALQFGRK